MYNFNKEWDRREEEEEEEQSLCEDLASPASFQVSPIITSSMRPRSPSALWRSHQPRRSPWRSHQLSDSYNHRRKSDPLVNVHYVVNIYHIWGNKLQATCISMKIIKKWEHATKLVAQIESYLQGPRTRGRPQAGEFCGKVQHVFPICMFRKMFLHHLARIFLRTQITVHGALLARFERGHLFTSWCSFLKFLPVIIWFSSWSFDVVLY